MRRGGGRGGGRWGAPKPGPRERMGIPSGWGGPRWPPPGPHKATPYPKPPAAPAPFRPLGQPGAAPYSQPLGLSLSHASHLAHAGMFNLPQPMPGANQLAGAPSNPWAHAPAAAAYPLSVAGYAQAPASATYCAATHMGMPIALCGRV